MAGPPCLRARVQEILDASLRDNQKARRILADGGYESVIPSSGAEPFDSQEALRQRAVFQTRRGAEDPE